MRVRAVFIAVFRRHEGVRILTDFFPNGRVARDELLQSGMRSDEIFVVNERRILAQLFLDLRMIVEERVRLASSVRVRSLSLSWGIALFRDCATAGAAHTRDASARVASQEVVSPVRFISIREPPKSFERVDPIENAMGRPNRRAYSELPRVQLLTRALGEIH